MNQRDVYRAYRQGRTKSITILLRLSEIRKSRSRKENSIPALGLPRLATRESPSAFFSNAEEYVAWNTINVVIHPTHSPYCTSITFLRHGKKERRVPVSSVGVAGTSAPPQTFFLFFNTKSKQMVRLFKKSCRISRVRRGQQGIYGFFFLSLQAEKILDYSFSFAGIRGRVSWLIAHVFQRECRLACPKERKKANI